MREFIITFSARKKDAIGTHSTFRVKVEAEDKEAAILALYEEYEHIYQPAVYEVTDHA